MRWKMVKRGGKWKKRLVPDIDEWVTLLILILIANIVVIQMIIKGA